MRDIYSNFGFFQAIPAQDFASGGVLTGATIDLQGFDAATFIAEVTTPASASAASQAMLILQHGLASAAGVSVWSDVPPSQMIHSVVGQDGAFSTSAELGVWQSIGTEDASGDSAVYAVGYNGDGKHRYVRMKVSQSAAAAHGFSVGAVCVLGKPANWPVNEPV